MLIKTKQKKILMTALILVIAASIVTYIILIKRGRELAPYKGIWIGEITEGNITYDLQMDIYSKGLSHVVKVSSSTFAFHYLSVEWDRKDDQLIFRMKDKVKEGSYRLGIEGDETMSGILSQGGNVYNITFYKSSDKAVNGKYYSDYSVLTYKERKKQLIYFSEYAEDDVKVPFTYELNNREKYQDLIDEYNLDTLVEGSHDIERMKVLLAWVSSNFKHDGNSGMPNKRDAHALIDYCKQNDGINCRGLSIILAEMLRTYGISAKHITCMPMETVFEDCHVIVHAYSEELKQWIMLDPTYNLVLQDNNGDYVNLSILRDVLINDIDNRLTANKSAGRNGQTFNLEEYLRYMTKNTFRFSCATDFYYGAESGRNSNIVNELVPLKYIEDSGERKTTSESVFWALP